MREIDRDEWPLLRDVYRNDRTNLTGYDLINSFLHGENVKIYAADDNWLEHGSFVLIQSFDSKADIYFNTGKGSLLNLQLSLNSLQLNIPHLFCGYGDNYKVIVENYWLAKGLSLEQLEHQGTFVYHLPHAEIQPFDVGSLSDITIAPLESEHASLVNAHWAYRSNDSITLIRNLITHNISAGAFNREGELLAWCLRSPHGSLCNLHVLPSHRRLGLASHLIRFMAQEIGATGSELLATIVFNNEISKALFEKLGFKHIHDIYWAFVPAS